MNSQSQSNISKENKNSYLQKIGISKKIMSILYDNDLIHRYGTTLLVNNHEYEMEIQNRYEVLKNEFRKINKDENDYIDISELKDFIKNYNFEEYLNDDKVNSNLRIVPNDNYCIRLFEILDLNKDSKITIHEFIESYLILEEKVKLKKLKLVKLKEELEISLKKTQEEYKKHENEKLNAFGVSSDAHVKICLLQAKDLRPMDYNGKSDPYCVLSINGKHKQTSSYKPNTLNPVWNEEFYIPVSNKDEDVLIEIFDKDTFGGDDLEGIVTIHLNELLHQEKIDDWIGLKRLSGDEEMGFLQIRIQFVWSKKQYNLNLIEKSERQLQKIDQDMLKLEETLKLISAPFGILFYGEILKLFDSGLMLKDDEALHYSKSSRYFLAKGKLRDNESFAKQMDNVIKGVFKINVEWGFLTNILVYMNIILCLIVALLSRSDFLGLFICIFVFVLFIIQKKLEILDYMKSYLKINFISVIYDIIWLIFHFKGYWSGSDYDYSELTLKRWTYFFSFTNCIVKVILLISLTISYDKAMKRKRSSLINLNQK